MQACAEYNFNLTDLVSSGTYARPDYVPSTAEQWYDEMARMGLFGKVTATVTNVNNPAFMKTYSGNLPDVHKDLYKLKMKVGASMANENTRKKKGRVYANGDYVVKLTNKEYQFDLSSASFPTFTIDTPSLDDSPVFTISIDNGIEYAFNEKGLLEEMQEYIDSTYDAHYSQDKYQSTEIIEDMGHGMGFALGNVIKYCQRYGKKNGFNRDDLKKVIHYGIIALAMHDRKE